jgi:hypothetical protein
MDPSIWLTTLCRPSRPFWYTNIVIRTHTLFEFFVFVFVMECCRAKDWSKIKNGNLGSDIFWNWGRVWGNFEC